MFLHSYSLEFSDRNGSMEYRVQFNLEWKLRTDSCTSRTKDFQEVRPHFVSGIILAKVGSYDDKLQIEGHTNQVWNVAFSP